MADSRRCGNTEEHRWHSWVSVEDADCSGRAACGEMNHPPHTYKKTVELWCDGICKCGRKDLHGMGAHK